MDDFNVSSLHESKNEWSARLVTILTPLIIDGFKSILEEALKLCRENGEMDKYLMTFQNFISRIPKWNQTIIETETKRICDKSKCSYLEDLVTCVHIIQLKILTSMRVGQKQKKVDINIPKLEMFVHKVYISVARRLYKNVYLFEVNIRPLNIQKNQREVEIIVQECILNTLRESIPVESILKAYMDETVEENVTEETKEIIEHIPPAAAAAAPAASVAAPPPFRPASFAPPPFRPPSPPSSPSAAAAASAKLSFNDIDYVSHGDGGVEHVTVPKSVENLELIGNARALQKKQMDLEDGGGYDDDSDNDKIKISSDSANLDLKFDDLMIDTEIL